MRKKFEELDLLDNFLMNAVASNPDVGEDACRIIVATLLQRDVGKIRVIAQREIPPVTPEKRGIRLDVEVEEDTDTVPNMNIYDIEPHREPRVPESLPRRTRFYQAKIDSRRLKHGEKKFQRLPNLYIINILDYDPFGYDQMCYTIKNKCEEVPGLDYDDGLKLMYFNIQGVNGGNEAIHNLLKFMLNSKAENVVDDTTRKMYDYVNLVKQQSEERDRYMTWDEFYDLDIAEARAEGENLLASLINKMISDGRDADIPRATKDTQYRESLYVQYGLKQPSE